MSRMAYMEGQLIIKRLNIKIFGVLWNEAKVNNSNALSILIVMCIHHDIHT